MSSLYSKFYEAYKKCYSSSISKEKIQRNANELWKSFKDDKHAFPANVEKKISELLQIKTKNDAALLNFFTKQVRLFYYKPKG